MDIIFKDMPRYNEFTKIEHINKGWSNDKKYYIETKKNEKLLLRIGDISQFDFKKEEFSVMQKISKLGVSMSMPLEFGLCNNNLNTYTLLSWAIGDDVEGEIKNLSIKNQYELGVKAGKLLKSIHSIPAPENQENWEKHFNRKINIKIKGYNECSIKVENADKFIEYIQENRHLLKNRPQCLHHGDYHLGNMIIDDKGKLTIIDFNRFDYGDPWEEFNRIVWCASSSKYFASGRINGYFNDDVPLEFFRLLALYISSNSLSSIYWAIPFGQDEVNVMINQVKDVLAWYDNMQNVIPNWYIKGV